MDGMGNGGDKSKHIFLNVYCNLAPPPKKKGKQLTGNKIGEILGWKTIYAFDLAWHLEENDVFGFEKRNSSFKLQTVEQLTFVDKMTSAFPPNLVASHMQLDSKTVVIDLLKTMNFNPSWLYHLPPLNPSWNEDNHDLWARYWYHDHGRWCWRSFLKKFSRFPSVVGDSMTLKERQSLDAFRTWYVYCPEWGYWHWLFSPSPKQHAEGLLFPMLFLCRCKGDGVLWKPSRMEPVIYYRYHLGNWLL